MHWPSVPDALTAEPSHPPSLVAVPFGSTKDGGRLVLFCLKYPSLHFSGCCAVWKHQRSEGTGKPFSLTRMFPLVPKTRKKDRNSLVDPPGAYHCAYDRPSRISTVPSPQKHLRTSSQANRPDFASDSHLLDIHSSPISPELDRPSP